MRYAILNEKREVVPVDDVITWGKWFEKHDRIVKQETIGDVKVSTVFLGLDHSFGSGPPDWFETMIFNGRHDGYCERCETWDQAEAQHAQAVKLVKDEPEKSDVG